LDLSAFGPEANTRIEMVLHERVAFAAKSADLRRIHTWLLSLWAGATAENLLRHIEDRTTPAMELWFGNDMWIAEISSDLSQNEDFLACKRLIKNVRCEPRKTVLTLRALANKGRAQTTDPILNFLVGVPDGVAGNVLSFWPPAARYYEVRRPGTGQVPFRPYREPWVLEGNRWTNIYHSISASLAHNGKSFEELRLEDYELGRDEGKWWPGGTLQISRVRVCATCRRSLDKLNYSRTQWNKKQVGVSRCRECVRVSADEIDIDAIAHTLATLNT